MMKRDGCEEGMCMCGGVYVWHGRDGSAVQRDGFE